MTNSKNLIGIILAVALVGAVVFATQKHDPASGGGQVACSMEAKICPDGSAVGRVGPTCEFAACPTPSDGRIAAGYVSGHVTIGPFCPVEQMGHPCQVPPEAYTSRSVIVYESNATTVKESVALDASGNYKIALGPGTYFLQIQPAGIGAGEKKKAVVSSFNTTTVNFDIDTGIR